jgi:hypothetical protein
MAGLKIDDRKTPMPQPEITVEVEASVIGATVPETATHVLDIAPVAIAHDTANPAHAHISRYALSVAKKAAATTSSR